MDWFQFFTLIGTILGAAGFIFKELKSFESEIRADVKEQSSRTDKLYEMFYDSLNEQSARSDKLYEMFIDLLKSKG